ncbi:hypothetical protein H3C66_01065 [Patescibacteria group bacterium]|nr:hypothetical protein [Patescibacteria group bacterium]
MTTAVIDAPVTDVSIKTMQVHVNALDTTWLFEFRNFTPLGGEIVVTNVGVKTPGRKATKVATKTQLTVSVMLVEHNRTIGADSFALSFGESETVSVGFMPPGTVRLSIGDTFGNLCEVISFPSPGKPC